MYKKITHNITEEHFAHPLAAELKKKVDKIIVKSTPPKATLPDSPETALHFAVHGLIANLASGVRNYTVAELGGLGDAAYIASKLLTDIKEFSPTLAAYYSTKVGDEAVMHLTDFAKTFVEIVTAAKADKDISKATLVALSHLDSLAKVLSMVNPTLWPESTVKEYLHQYATNVIDQVKARVKKDWVADAKAYESALNLLMNGPVAEGALRGNPDFATVFASGIAKQFPALFTN